MPKIYTHLTTQERAELSEISISKLVDIASPTLAQTCARGKTIPKAKLEFMRADGPGEPIKYYEVELENVLIGHIAPNFVPGGYPSEISPWSSTIPTLPTQLSGERAHA